MKISREIFIYCCVLEGHGGLPCFMNLLYQPILQLKVSAFRKKTGRVEAEWIGIETGCAESECAETGVQKLAGYISYQHQIELEPHRCQPEYILDQGDENL